jgi:hypothetical protein
LLLATFATIGFFGQYFGRSNALLHKSASDFTSTKHQSQPFLPDSRRRGAKSSDWVFRNHSIRNHIRQEMSVVHSIMSSPKRVQFRLACEAFASRKARKSTGLCYATTIAESLSAPPRRSDLIHSAQGSWRQQIALGRSRR